VTKGIVIVFAVGDIVLGEHLVVLVSEDLFALLSACHAILLLLPQL
jgi:hypothetical protein